MQLISVVHGKSGWKIEYEDKARDKIPVKVKYPSTADIGLGKPTRKFLQMHKLQVFFGLNLMISAK